MIATLIAATPYLAGGFVLNLVISALAMALGSLTGAVLAMLRGTGRWWLSGPAMLATSLCRNVPSFVLLFYVAFLLPVEIQLSGRILAVPLWIKATVALTIPVTGFMSDQARGYRRSREAGDPQAGATFLVAWVQYLLIIIMASATASVIGADEIVGRANRLVAQHQGPEFLLLTYGYVALWFIGAGLAASWTMHRLARREPAP